MNESSHSSIMQQDLSKTRLSPSVLPLQVPMLGKFRYMGKPDKQHTAPVKCIIHMFVMHVADELAVWPEMAQRQRFWVSTPASLRHTW